MALGPGEHDQVCIVTLMVSCKSQEQVVRAFEAIGRMSMGLALDGLSTNITTTVADAPPEGWGSG